MASNSEKQLKSNEQIAIRVSLNSIIVNIALTVFKLIAGIVAHSGAMISDAVHSASDVLSTLIVIGGVRIASKAPDHEHPYGHDRFECVASIILSGMLLVTGAGIGWKGLQNILSSSYDSLTIPGKLALIAAVVSIVVKEGMYWYTKFAAERIDSSALMADAWHHRSDAMSSIGSFVGILGARLGFPVMDPLASVIISLFIIKASIDIFRDAISKMTDQACDDEVVQELQNTIHEVPGVLGIDALRTRDFGSMIYVDVEIQANAQLPLSEAHGIAQQVHDDIEHRFPRVKHCMVHVNPAE
jgi:cation diffusion facilitator family transporter